MVFQTQFDAEIQRIIENAIREDVGDGDHSSMACIPASANGKAKLLVKEEGIISGVEFARKVFEYMNPDTKLDIRIKDGEAVAYGDIVFYVEGNAQLILKAERLVLNAMQRMSAIATRTAKFVKLLEGTKTRILDTRKTTPGVRALEKWAVRTGGGENHRFGLYDMIMLKDNHIDLAGGITKAINSTKQYIKENNKDLKIIVEARDMQEVKEILKNEGIHRILLDNFDVETTREAVAVIGDRCFIESSGGINEQSIRAYAECSVDYISLGVLTYGVHNMDLSLKTV